MLEKNRYDFWREVDKSEFVSVPECWCKCGGFCCSWRHPDITLKFIPRGGTLFYTEEEYQYFSLNKRLAASQISSVDIGFGNDNRLRFYYAPCDSPEKCRKFFDRSLYCKLYPFLPLVDLDGFVSDLGFISPYDMTLKKVDEWCVSDNTYTSLNRISCLSKICDVKQHKKKYVDEWNRNELLKDPYVLFHLRTMCHFYFIFLNKLEQYRDRLLCGDFWIQWELMYLQGTFWDLKVLSDCMTSDYTELVKRHGAFIKK